MYKIFLPFTFIVSLAGNINAQNPWELMKGPGESNISSIDVIDNRLYVGTNSGGLYYSDNESATWTRVNNIIEENINQVGKVGNKLVVGINNEYPLFSADNGASWNHIGNDYNMRTIQSFANKGETLYLVNSNGLFITSDWGQNIKNVKFDSLFTFSYPEKIVMHNDTIYIGISGGTVRSLDLGKTWHKLTVPSISGLLHLNGKIYASHYGGVSVSSDGGATWTLKANGLKNSGHYDLKYRNNKLYVCGIYGLYSSSNLGNSWLGMSANIPSDGYVPFTTSFDFLNNGLYAGIANYGLFKTVNSGIDWINAGVGIYADDIRSIVAFGETVVTGSVHGGIYVSKNGGQKFTFLGKTGATTQAMKYNPTNKLVYATGNGSLRLIDLQNMVFVYPAVQNNFPDAITDINIYKDTVYLLTSKKIYKGKTPTGPFIEIYDHTATGEEMSKFIIHNETVIIGSDNRNSMFYYGPLTKTKLTFTKAPAISGNGNSSDYNPRCFAATKNRIFTATVHGLFISDDLGQTWKKTMLANNYMQTIATSGDYVFVGSLFDENFYSKDNGNNWDLANDGFQTEYLNTTAISGSYLYAGAAHSGVWRMPLTNIITGVKETENVSHTLVYPNPASDFLILNVNNSASYSITDFSGNAVLSGTTSGENKISLVSLQSGIYFVHTEGKVTKVIKN